MQTQITNQISKAVTEQYGKPKPILPEKIYKDVLGIPKKTFSKYLTNEKQPRLDELERIANWLKINPKDLF